MQNRHQPVLLQEAIDGLAIKPNGIYVDGTFGRGGHAEMILHHLSAQGKLLAIDKDPAAIQIAAEKFGDDKRFHLWHGSFIELPQMLQTLKIQGGIDGLLLDLGTSSPQLDTPERGFSFLREGPLDMRMNPECGIDAATWINQVSADELATVLKEYGEERFAKRIANAIVRLRTETPIRTTKQLAETIAMAAPTREKHKHPATRSFQAIRIYINRELEELGTCLENSIECLAMGGRLVVISFHSLEDRIVKRFIKKHEKGDPFPSDLPIKQKELHPRLKRVGRSIKPTSGEIAANPRARSAVLRIAEKIG